MESSGNASIDRTSCINTLSQTRYIFPPQNDPIKYQYISLINPWFVFVPTHVPYDFHIPNRQISGVPVKTDTWLSRY